MSLESSSRFGTFYESHGIRYLTTPNCHIGIREDKVKPFNGTVEKAETTPDRWVKVKLQGTEESVYIGNGWIQDYGWLKTGDKIAGILDIGEPQFLKAWYVKKIPQPIEEAGKL